jgi:hypothetical protein
MADMNEAVQRFNAEVDAAVSRARRASSDAAERAEGFRAENERLSTQLRDGAPRGEKTESGQELRSAAQSFRRDHGLPVPEFPEPAPGRDSAETQRPRTAARRGELGYDDEDFSQGRLLF